MVIMMRRIDSPVQEIEVHICAFVKLSAWYQGGNKPQNPHGVIARDEATSAQDNQLEECFWRGKRRMHGG